jgi:hypothetical protein
LSFARAAAQLLPEHEETAFEPTGSGLTLLAETELSLERPLERLRALYGDELHIAAPAVRYRNAEPIEEPHMGLRVLSSPSHFNSLRRDLFSRGAVITDSELNEQFGVLRASAPLAVLVGYPAQVKQLSQGRAQLAMWLSHYAPMNQPPGGTAA